MYNFGAGSFLSKKLCRAHFIQLKLTLIPKTGKLGTSTPPFRGVRDNPRPSLMAH